MNNRDTALIWFRNDLRVEDQLSLYNASQKYKRIIGVFCFEPYWFKKTSYGFRKMEKFRTQFIIETVHTLRKRLGDYNIPLFVYYQSAGETISNLIKDQNCKEVFLQKEWTPEELNILKNVKSKVAPDVTFTEYYHQFLFEPDQLPVTIANLPEVFSVFRKQVEKQCKVNPCYTIKKEYTQESIENNTKIPTLEDLGFDSFTLDTRSAFPFQGGEIAALERMHDYFWNTQNLSRYKKTRNGLLGTNYSSKFSAWLSIGCISPKRIYIEVKQYEKEIKKNDSTYWLIFELIWRDYFKYISLKHQNSIFQLKGILQHDYTWHTSEKTITNWIEGNTGEDFVDANMKELKETGWMSNRGRQNVASFFAKECHLDWRIGAAYFEAMLIDYDVHSNYGNWMYVSGVGNDPRNRKFNIQLQAKRYDPQYEYQNKWLKGI